MNLNFKALKTDIIDQHILMIILNRPQVRNAINYDMICDFHDLWKQVSDKHHELRCVIITGADSAFCAGADLKERKNLSVDRIKSQLGLLRNSILSMQNCRIPIISAVNGAAYGGGLELMLASDFAYAAKSATFAQSETKIGIIPGALGTQNLPRACGLNRAKELIFTAAPFDAQQAFQWGIINKLCEPEALLNEVIITAKTICENAPIAICEAKKALNVAQHIDLQSGFSKEFEAYQRALETKDREEGIKAFNEKRKPIYTGE